MNETLQRELSWLEKTHQLSSQSKLSSESFPIISMGTVLFFLVPALPFLPLIILEAIVYGRLLDALLYLCSFPAALLLWTGCSAAINVDRYRVDAYYANGHVRITGKGKRIRSASVSRWDYTSVSSVKYNRAGKVIKSAVFRWDDVGFVDHSVSVTHSEDSGIPDYEHHYRLRRHDGTTIKGWTATASAELFERMTLPPLLSQALAVYQSGQSLSFGVLGLSQEGIRYRNRLLPWEDLQSLNFDENSGTITLKSVPQPGEPLALRPPWASIAVGRVPNFRVLARLVQVIQAAAHP